MVAAALRDRGERVTPARLAVAGVLERSRQHLNADQIAGQATQLVPGIHRATVYRALATLGDLELVSHTHLGGRSTVYHLTVPGPGDDPVVGHAHLQCTSCGRVLDTPADTLDPVAAQLEAALNFRLDPTHTALLGTCAQCRGGRSVSP